MKFPLLLTASATFLINATSALASPVFTVQLGSFDSEQKAAEHWQAMSSKYARQLGNLQPNISSLTLPPDNVTSYRIQAGPLTAVEEARDVCAALQSKQDRCFVVETAMFSPSALPSFAEAPVEQPLPQAPALPFDPERSSENIVAEAVTAPDIGAAAKDAMEVATEKNNAEVIALSDSAAKKSDESNSLLSRLNPFSDSEETPDVAVASSLETQERFTPEQQKARLALNDSLNNAPSSENYADITSVSNEEVIRKRDELEDARAKLNAIKLSEARQTTATSSKPDVQTSNAEIPSAKPLVQAPETAEVFTPPVVTTQPPAPVITPQSSIVASAPSSNTPGLLGTLNSTPQTSSAAPAPKLSVKPPMLDIPKTNEPVTTNEQALTSLPRVRQPVAAPYIPPIAPRSTRNILSPTVIAKPIPTPRSTSPLQAPERIITVPTVTPNTPGVLGTLTTKTVSTEKNNDVAVAEAIRVPLTSQTAPAAPIMVAPATASPALKDVRYRGSPSQASNHGNIWTEINAFDSRKAAMAYWQEFSRHAVSARPLRVRVTQPFRQSEDVQRVSLKAGPFDSHASASALCQHVNLEKYSCTTRAVSDTAAAAPALGASRLHTRTNARDRRNAYEAKRGYAGSGRTLQNQGYWIQLGAYPSGEMAADAWGRLQVKYAPALDGMYPHIVEPHLGSHQQPTFRLRSGPYLSYTVARDVCARIKAKRGLCLVTRQ